MPRFARRKFTLRGTRSLRRKKKTYNIRAPDLSSLLRSRSSRNSIASFNRMKVDSNLSHLKPSLQKGYLPFGPEYYAKLPYSETIQLTSAVAGVAVSHRFRINGLYDPDLTGGGHQPYQRDELAQLYNRYTVYGCKVILRFSAPTTPGMKVGYRIRNYDNTVNTSGMTQGYINEVGGAVMKHIPTTGSQQRQFNTYISVARINGVSKSEVSNDDEYSSVIGNNPLRGGSIDLFLIEPTSTGNSVLIDVFLYYYVKFHAKQTVAQS